MRLIDHTGPNCVPIGQAIADAPREEQTVLSSVAPLVGNTRWVFFNADAIREAIAQWGHLIDDEMPHQSNAPESLAQWLFIRGALNFCFWADLGKATWTVIYQGRFFSGAWGLQATLTRAIEEGLPVTDSRFLADLSEKTARHIFRGIGEIPLLSARLTVLRQIGQVLNAQWDGSIHHLLEEARGSVLKALQLLVTSFPSFRDETIHHGRKICFWKRGQLFMADVYQNLAGGVGWRVCGDKKYLTVFPDYKLPQVLRHLGILQYEQSLAERVDACLNLSSGSEEEIEIRAMTVWAGEQLRRALMDKGRDVLSIQIDRWLWRLGQMDAFRGRPYHRCRTIHY